MATLTIRMPDDKADRLKALAAERGLSVNQLFLEWATIGITEFDVYARFKARAARGSRDRGLATLARLNELDRDAQAASYGLQDHDQTPFE